MALTDPVPSQAIDVFKRNMEDSDRFVNQTSGAVTNRTGKTMRPLPVISDDIEQQIIDLTADINAAKADLYPIVKFRFLVDTYEITNRNELGDTATGETYRYVGATLPFNVTPATNPVGNPDFVQVIQTDHNNLTNRNAVGAHDEIYGRNFKTITDLIAQVDASGQAVDLSLMSGSKVFWRGYYAESDGGSNWGIVKTGDSASLVNDGGSIFVIVNDAVNGVWIEANLKGKSVSVKKFGFINSATEDTTDKVVAAINYVNSIGGGKVTFANCDGIVSAMVFEGLSNVTIDGARGSLSKLGSGTNTLIFNFKGGSKDVTVENFQKLDGKYYSDNPSTGSNPVILIGDQSGSGDGGFTNEGVTVRYNGITGANWAGVVIYGRSNDSKTLTPLNKRIRVYKNHIYDCGGNGVFVYKNSDDVRVYKNTIDLVGYDGVVFDTMAASDTVTSEPLTDVHAYRNTIKRFGKIGQGIGVLAKGDIQDFSIDDNTVKEGLVQSSGSFVNYGILINKDANNVSPKQGSANRNKIKNIKSSLTGVGLLIGEGCEDVTANSNNITDTSNANLWVLAGCKNITTSNNTLSAAGNGVYAARYEGTSSNKIENLTAIGNTYRQGTGNAVGGFRFDHIKHGRSLANLAPDFSTSAINATNYEDMMWQIEDKDTAPPTTGSYAQGAIRWNATPSTVSPVVAWVCILSGSPGVWRPHNWIVGKAPTANRPTLTANDIGVTYLDTTINANGVLISWNGLAWVDSTGATV